MLKTKITKKNFGQKFTEMKVFIFVLFASALQNCVAFKNGAPQLPVFFDRPIQTQEPKIIKSTNFQKTDENSWSTSLSAVETFSVFSKIIAKSYIISSIDRKNLSINTDWDKFFIDGRLFRNRLSVSVFPVDMRNTEVVIKNTLEYLAKEENNQQNQVWLPCPDITDEVKRIVQSATLASTKNASSQFRQR
jgi:hypothetical protein